MKTCIITALCLALAGEGAFGQSAPPPPNKDSIWLAGLVVVVAIVAGYVIVKVSRKIPAGNATVTLVLEKSIDHATWTPVATNTVTLTDGDYSASRWFPDQMTDSSAFYRARIKR